MSKNAEFHADFRTFEKDETKFTQKKLKEKQIGEHE